MAIDLLQGDITLSIVNGTTMVNRTTKEMINEDANRTKTMDNNSTKETTKAIFGANHEVMDDHRTTTTTTTRIMNNKMDNDSKDLGVNRVIAMMAEGANRGIIIIETLIDATITTAAIMATVLTSLLSDNNVSMTTEVTTTETTTTTMDRNSMINETLIKDEQLHSSNLSTTTNRTRNRP